MGDLADVFDGTHQTPEYVDKGINFISVENIDTLIPNKFVTKDFYNKNYKNKFPEKGDVFLTRIGDVGTPRLIDKNGDMAYYVTLALLKPKNIDSSFLVSNIQSSYVQNELWRKTLHIAFPKKINLGDINKVTTKVPSINEQNKIGIFFNLIDSLITLHKRKSSQLKLLKKEMIKNSMTLTSLYPILRFSGFNDEWEISKIEDSFKERKNRNASGRLLSVTIDDGVVPTSSLDRIVNTSEDKSNYKSVFKNDLVYNSMRMWQGASGISKLDGIVSPAYTVVTPIDNTLTDYFSYYFKRNDLIYKFRTHSQGLTSDTWTLRYIPFSEIKIRKPKTIEEQLKIFNFIKSMDDMLLINKNKIKLLNDIKKLYLDNLFI